MYILEVCNFISFDTCIHPWSNHHNQCDEDHHNPEGFLLPFALHSPCSSFTHPHFPGNHSCAFYYYRLLGFSRILYKRSNRICTLSHLFICFGSYSFSSTLILKVIHVAVCISCPYLFTAEYCSIK